MVKKMEGKEKREVEKRVRKDKGKKNTTFKMLKTDPKK